MKADIISMSFGFRDEDDVTLIRDAISDVWRKREGKVIFVSSAGNSGTYQEETFPANNPCVISIRATDLKGTFSPDNPRPQTHGPEVHGTYGSDIPDELRRYCREVCEPGTSVATAVAAGIAATILSYATLLESVHPGMDEESKNLIDRLWTGKGMHHMFHEISDDMGDRCRFVNPVSFFTKYNSYGDTSRAMCTWMRRVQGWQDSSLL